MTGGPVAARLPLVLVAWEPTTTRSTGSSSGWTAGWPTAARGRVDVLVQYGSSAAPRRPRQPLLGHDELQDAMARAAWWSATAARRRSPRPGATAGCRSASRATRAWASTSTTTSSCSPAGWARPGSSAWPRPRTALRLALDEALGPAGPVRGRLPRPGVGGAPGLGRFADLVGELLPARAPEVRVPVLYIGGLGRSGSTLLERCVGQVDRRRLRRRARAPVGARPARRRAVRVRQPVLRVHVLAACRQERVRRLGQGRRRRRARAQGVRRPDPVRRRLLRAPTTGVRPRAAPLRRPAHPAVRRRARGLRRRGGGRLQQARVDRAGAAAAPGIDLRVVHVVRDSPAVAYSWTKRVPRPEAAPGEYMASWSPLQTAAHWTTANILLDRAAGRHTEPAGALRGLRGRPERDPGQGARVHGAGRHERALAFVDGPGSR